jgi:hypothetical protein
LVGLSNARPSPSQIKSSTGCTSTVDQKKTAARNVQHPSDSADFASWMNQLLPEEADQTAAVRESNHSGQVLVMIWI